MQLKNFKTITICFLFVYSCYIVYQNTLLNFKIHVAEARISILQDQLHDFSLQGTYEEGLTDGLLRSSVGTYSDGYKDGYHYAIK
jgi:hypothetical protein